MGFDHLEPGILNIIVCEQWTLMKFMIDGGSTAPLPKARKWLIKYPEASRDLLELLKEKVVEYLVEQVRAGAQVRNLIIYEP